MKQHTQKKYCFEMVAPHAGAWIETLTPERLKTYSGVAPHAGAWIETKFHFNPIR